MIEFLKKITEQYNWLPEFAAIIGVLLLVFSKVRKGFGMVFKWAYLWLVFPFKGWTAINTILEEVKGLKETTVKTSEDITALKEIVGYNGGGGLMDIVGYIAGYQSSQFWLTSQPGFIMDEQGNVLDATHAYCSLLGLASKAELKGVAWKAYIDRDPAYNILDEYKEAAKREEAFRGHIDFFNASGQDVGNWIILARPISAEKAKTKRYIGYFYPASEKSKAIALKNNWAMNPPL